MKGSIDKSMIVGDRNSPTDIVFDGSKLTGMSVKTSKTEVRVTSLSYDPATGTLFVIASDGSTTPISGLVTRGQLPSHLKVKTGDTGPVGLPGEDSTKHGRKGRDGPPGVQGVRGDRGHVGRKGEQGDTGQKGKRGDKGRTGRRGQKGFTGFDGDMGLAGDKGDIGDQGPAGIRGDTGDQGPVGLDGDRGNPGCSGDIGPIGPKGERGDIGPRGPVGDMGPPGRPGGGGGGGADGKPGNPGPIVDIIAGSGMFVAWEPDEDGYMVNKKISSLCKPSVTPSTSSTTVAGVCDITIEDKNANRIIDDDYDVYINGVFAFSMPGSVSPSTVYHVSAPAGQIELTFKRTKDNKEGTLKELVFTYSDGSKDTKSLSDWGTPIGSFAAQKIKINNKCSSAVVGLEGTKMSTSNSKPYWYDLAVNSPAEDMRGTSQLDIQTYRLTYSSDFENFPKHVLGGLSSVQSKFIAPDNRQDMLRMTCYLPEDSLYQVDLYSMSTNILLATTSKFLAGTTLTLEFTVDNSTGRQIRGDLLSVKGDSVIVYPFQLI